MARAGGGRSSSGRSGGGRSSSRSGGGHHVSSRSSSSRSSGGGFSSSSRRSSSGFSGSSRRPTGGFGGTSRRPNDGLNGSSSRRQEPPRYTGPVGGYDGPGMPPPRRRRPVYYRGGSGLGCSGFLFVIMIIALVFMFSSIKTCSDSHTYKSSSYASGSQTSSIVREKLDTDIGYISDCIIDELGWFDNESRTESELKEFWKKTGVQPYIILKDYDASLTTDEEKEQWALDYYDENFTAENIFLYVYFAEEDTDNDVGYMCYANGMQISSIMDSEAIDIFWGNIDEYWYTDLSTDDLFITVFNETAETIMYRPTSVMDILKWVLIVVVVIAVGVTLYIVMTENNKREKEKAEADKKILETPLEDLVEEELTKKYTE